MFGAYAWAIRGWARRLNQKNCLQLHDVKKNLLQYLQEELLCCLFTASYGKMSKNYEPFQAHHQ